jgi:hypothetical protein
MVGMGDIFPGKLHMREVKPEHAVTRLDFVVFIIGRDIQASITYAFVALVILAGLLVDPSKIAAVVPLFSVIGLIFEYRNRRFAEKSLASLL